MARLDDLPKLPKCLRGLMWLMRNDDDGKLQYSEDRLEKKPSTLLDRSCGEMSKSGQDRLPSTQSFRRGHTCDIAFLTKELTSLRQMDVSLFCQLWRLNEQLSDYKRAVYERSSDTIFIGSSRDVMETSNDYENISYNARIYENISELENFYENSSSMRSMTRFGADEDQNESIYLEPISYDTDDDSWSTERTKPEKLTKNTDLSNRCPPRIPSGQGHFLPENKVMVTVNDDRSF